MIGIYKILSPSGNVYIGQSWDVRTRIRDYSIKSTQGQPLLNRSFIKYGKDNHIFTVLAELPSDISQDVLNEYEVLYMELYRNCGIALLNCREGGSKGKLSIETKKILSEINKGKPAWNKGITGVIKLSEETKALQSKAKKGKRPNNFGVRRSSSAIESTALKNKGKKRTEEQIVNISKACIGRPYHGKNKGKVRTPEMKLRYSEVQKSRIKKVNNGNIF